LLSGIRSLVNDPNFKGLAKQLYAHAAINPRGSFKSAAGAVYAPLKNKPAYIDKLQFATALLDVTGLSAASATEAAKAPGPPAVAALQAALNDALTGSNENPQIQQLLSGIVQRTQGDIHLVRVEVAAWFDNAMDRVGGAFKRWTQLASFIIALVAAILLNVDTIHLATLLWEKPTIADQLKVPADVQQVVAGAPAGQDAVAAEQAREAAAIHVATFLQGSLPVGWPPGHFFEASTQGKWWWSSAAGWAAFPGWLVTAFATLFGAPFWFDVLQGVVRLKGSGPSPAEKASGSAASA
jgi:hypothetical protein